ncbi:hypothetical protein CHO01_02880 [Cellulomonas hominis]|uniref:Glycosyltransferase RgtA/B/C/D-like domain-containing protein n=1 Tax=Cellulomonas hominis TaxID=156981 RepID=A0A511F7C3_9CELL|nr:hypothetical protein [Cellulomonas hominis]MBB5474033.1 hypothetical protein [Cellulomonas hominis]GEL45172.1 hypothetical protein CHO01_02880 [Cellulomonas hominis]
MTARAQRLLLSLPDRLPVALLCLGVAGLLAVLAGVFRPVVVLPLAVALVALTWRLVPEPPAGRGHAGALVALGALCAGWVALGLRSVAEYVVVNRDPGFLTLQALWLTRHPAAPIPVGAAAEVDVAVGPAAAGTEAFWLQDGLLHAQGNKMLPALLAVQGWWGGERAVLAGGLAIGVVALVAVFAVARRFAGPWWALVPTAALAACLPFLVLTRAAYTEPLTVAFLCGGLALAHGVWGRPADRLGVARHALVGAMTGAVAAARIDGAVVVVGLALGYLAAGASPLGGADRRAAGRRATAAVGAGAAMVALGMVDVVRLSPAYVREHAGQLGGLLAVAAVVLAVAAAVLVRVGWARPRRSRLRLALHAHRAGIGWALAAAVVAAAALLASRPLWWEGRFTDPASGFGYAVSVLQQAAGEAVDPARSYDERTLAWVSWYLGVPVVVLGAAGLALLARRAARWRDPAATLLVAVVGVAAVFPLVRVSITPDQVWAVRRLVPATFPGLLVAATVALTALAGGWGAARRGRGGASSPGGAPAPAASGVLVARRGAAVALGAVVAAFPLTTWGSVAGVVELSGRATQAHAVCDALDDLGVDRVVWTHSAPFRYLATLRVVCDVEVVELLEPPSAADLAAVRAAWGGGPVAALSFDATDYPWSEPPATSVGGTASQTLGRTLTGPPDSVDTVWSEVWIGMVEQDGTVRPAP